MSQYIQVGILLITVPNLIVIALMLIVFVIAIVVRLPHPRADVPSEPVTWSDGAGEPPSR